MRGGFRPGVGHLGLVGGPLALKPSEGLLDGLSVGSASIRHGGLEEDCREKTYSSAEVLQQITTIIS